MGSGRHVCQRPRDQVGPGWPRRVGSASKPCGLASHGALRGDRMVPTQARRNWLRDAAGLARQAPLPTQNPSAHKQCLLPCGSPGPASESWRACRPILQSNGLVNSVRRGSRANRQLRHQALCSATANDGRTCSKDPAVPTTLRRPRHTCPYLRQASCSIAQSPLWENDREFESNRRRRPRQLRRPARGLRALCR